LAALSDPTWLSPICRKVSWLGSAASDWSMMPSERGTPLIVHNTPISAQVMRSSTLRRLTPRILGVFVGLAHLQFSPARIGRIDA
jgi:hypothetical protein